MSVLKCPGIEYCKKIKDDFVATEAYIMPFLYNRIKAILTQKIEVA